MIMRHGEHGHSHGLVHDSIKRSRGACARSCVVAGGARDHGDRPGRRVRHVRQRRAARRPDPQRRRCLTAIPLGIAFAIRSRRAEGYAGLAVVAAIFISALVAGVESIRRLIDPSPPTDLWVLAAAGAIGYLGNWIAAQIRTRAGHRLDCPGADRRRQPRPRRRLRLARRGRRRGSGRFRRADPGPDHRPADHGGHPAHHVGLLAHRSRGRVGRCARRSPLARSPLTKPWANSASATSGPDIRGR